jgi:hypothetical protein
MAKLEMLYNGQVFSCFGSEEFISRERASFMGNSKAEETETAKDVTPCVVVPRQRISAPIETVIKEIQSGNLDLYIGDAVICKLLTGEEVTFEVTDQDDEGIRFEMKELLECMARTDVEEWYEGFYKLLPKPLRDAIIPTVRRYRENGNGDIKEKECKIFMPSASEVFEPDNCYGDKGVYEQMEFYKDWRNRIRCTVSDNEPNAWWLLSAYSGHSTNFARVSNNGGASSNSATNAGIAAPVCFRIRKSN